jgi:hypothetical protein
MERRSFTRSRVPDAPQLASELMLVTTDDEKLRIVGSLWDVSESGASFVSTWRRALLDLSPGQPMQLIVRWADLTLCLDAELRHARPVAGHAIVLGMRLRRTPASASSLEQWPTLLWELRSHATLRNAS